MSAVRTFSIAGTVLALATVASAATSRQDVSAAGDGRADIASFRTDYNKLMDRYDAVFTRLGNSRGLALTAQGRASLRAVADEQLAKMFQKAGVPNLSAALKAAEKLEAVTPAQGSVAPRAADTPGFPGAPPILSECNNILHDSGFTFGALVAFEVARTVLAAAEFACEETVVIAGEGGNGAAACIPLAIAQDAAAIPFELADFCGGEEDSAIGQGSYDRLEHIHGDLEAARADILTSIDVHTQMIIDNANANREIILTAMKNLSCDLERLVHTPEGQRRSDIAECKGQPAFPFNWPEH